MSITPAEARAQRDADVKERRGREHACALDYLVYGDGLEADALALAEETMGMTFTSVRHAERCVFGAGDACSRRYDPAPYAEAEPIDLKMYEGTAIGALYGIGPATVTRTCLDDDGNTVTVEHELIQLEGWVLAPHSTHG